MELICPSCNNPMMQETSKFTYSDGRFKKFWCCHNCSITHSAHPDGRPVGVPANKETREWRQKAHKAFNKTWQQWGYSQGKAYILMQRLMGMTQQEAHIGNFDKRQCQILIQLLELLPEVQNPECLKKKDFIPSLLQSVSIEPTQNVVLLTD